MIDVLLDARMIRHSGIGTYLRGLWGEFQGHSFFKNHSLGLAVNLKAGLLRNDLNGRFPTSHFYSPIYSLQEQLEYPLRMSNCRLWHAPHYNAPVWKNTKLVVTIHDVIHWIFRGQFFTPLQSAYARFFIQNALRKADRVIAVSQKTREDLIQYFNAPPGKIRVVYEGVSPLFFESPKPEERRELLAKYGLPEKFYLYVGLIKPHKNVKRLIDVYQKLRRDRKIDSALVLVGKKDKRYPAGYETLKNLKTEEGIHYMAGLDSEKELRSLYHSAHALVHPSLYEGFGLTVLEAMASGTPVIVSSAASLPEVAGDAAHYIDPHSVDSMAEALIEFEENSRRLENLAEKGKEQAKKFSWAKAAEETIRVYEEVLSSS